jgi:hypothetical protein
VSVHFFQEEKAMRGNLQKVSLIVALWAGAVAPGLAADVPFKGVFAGQAVSAVPTDDPGVLLITTVGSGNATHLGSFTMVSPHVADLFTLEVEGTQNFTAANGDTLTASFTGQFSVIADGFLSASIDCTITGGTGRFAGAGGGYTFNIVFDPATLTDLSVIDGTIVLPGGD